MTKSQKGFALLTVTSLSLSLIAPAVALADENSHEDSAVTTSTSSTNMGCDMRTVEFKDHLEKNRAERLLNLLELVSDTYSHIGQERLDLLTRLKKVAEIAGVSPE